MHISKGKEGTIKEHNAKHHKEVPNARLNNVSPTLIKPDF